MSAQDQGTVPYHWSDGEGNPLPLGCRVQQIAVDRQGGALPRWLHHRGRVLGWDLTWLQVRMDHGGTFVVLRAHLLRALTPHGEWR